MKYLTAAIVTLSAVGVISAAQANKKNDDFSFKYRCKFSQSYDAGKGNIETTVCHVRGRHCAEHGKGVDVTESQNGCGTKDILDRNGRGQESEIEISCNNGFDLEDEVEGSFSRDTFLVAASDGDALAALKIEDLEIEASNGRGRNRGGDESDASLLISWDGSAQKFEGECEIDEIGPRPKPTKTVTPSGQ